MTRSTRPGRRALALAGLLCLWASPDATQASPADPGNAQAAVPALVHRSAFAGYRPWSEQPVGSWRDANDAVRRAGGWRAYARERVASGAAPAPGAARPSTAPAPPSPPTTGGGSAGPVPTPHRH